MVKLDDYNWGQVDRELIIGGSDMAGVLGYSKWSSPEIVMKQKLLNEKVEVNDAMFWGTALEGAVADVYEQLYISEGYNLFDPVKDWDRGHQIVHPEYEWLAGSPDRLITKGDFGEVSGGLEIKCIGYFSKKSWKDGVPIYYQVQAQVYMMLTGMKEWEFFVLHGGQAHFHVLLEESPLMQEQIIEHGCAFSQAVKEGGELNEATERYYELLGGRKNEEERINCIPMGKNTKNG